MKTERQVFLYGLGSVDKKFKVISFRFLDETEVSISNLMYTATVMKNKNGAVESVYAIDNRPGLRRDYAESVKEDSIESCAIFKDILERDGIRLI